MNTSSCYHELLNSLWTVQLHQKTLCCVSMDSSATSENAVSYVYGQFSYIRKHSVVCLWTVQLHQKTLCRMSMVQLHQKTLCRMSMDSSATSENTLSYVYGQFSYIRKHSVVCCLSGTVGPKNGTQTLTSNKHLVFPKLPSEARPALENNRCDVGGYSITVLELLSWSLCYHDHHHYNTHHYTIPSSSYHAIMLLYRDQTRNEYFKITHYLLLLFALVYVHLY